MNRHDIYSLTNFDFLASSFARMNGQGRHIDIRAVTGNMSKEQSAWFVERYNFYRMQGQIKATKAAQAEAELWA
ncbi:cell surface composition regulator GlgS [Franconibacter pulveris]|uniref:cell surface composition regulator GlgS n=1 Tax=Franconibacter pulveris TaxID=435910 RepID=UPI000495FC2C|nr:cell surface composition regulator GlgS [Franconibacter pulveris]